MNFRQAWVIAGVLALGASPGSLSTQQPAAKSLFAELCVACHGQAGAGDGPVASALTPRPASFVDPTFQAARTDQQLVAVITAGKPPMPAFGQQLSPAQVKSLVDYILQLGRQAKKKKP